jgi:hypothetical protein
MMRTLRGQLDAGETRRLLIDDGDFQHGFVCDEFYISPAAPLGEAQSQATSSILHINPVKPTVFDWSIPQQIGWAVYNTSPTNTTTVIDPDHIVVRELYITNLNDTFPLNYMVKIRDRTMTPAHGVLQMVKEVTYND